MLHVELPGCVVICMSRPVLHQWTLFGSLLEAVTAVRRVLRRAGIVSVEEHVPGARPIGLEQLQTATPSPVASEAIHMHMFDA